MSVWTRAALLALISCCYSAAEQGGIRLSGSAQPGCWSVEEIVGGLTSGIKDDREKALALHRFGMAHFIHFDGPKEDRDDYVTDPMKLLAVYGYALCGNNSSAMSALYHAAGLKARTRTMPGHSIPEVWFENKWNYIDTDMFGYVFLPDGKLASVDELTREPELFMRQKNPPDPYFPFDRKEDMASVFRGAKPSRDYHPYANAHIMNLSLRTSESARLFFRPQGQGRYFLTPGFRPDMGIEYKDYFQVGPVRKGSLAWCDQPPASHGNGVIEYAPDLRSRTFARENPERANVAAGQGRKMPHLVSQRPGDAASLVVRVASPWLIAGLQNDLTTFDDNTDAAIVSGIFWRIGENDENRISVSRDGGRTWEKVWENRYLGAVPFRVDLTRWANGEYGYLVKFEWTDRKRTGQVGLEALRLRTWVQLSPMALPRVVAGANKFRLDTAPSAAVLNHSRWDRNQGLPDQALENAAMGDKIPFLRPADPSRPAVLTFSPGTASQIRELRVSMAARAARGSQGIAAVLSISEDGGSTWRQLQKFAPDPDHTVNHMWFNHVLRGQPVDGRRCRLKVEVSGGGLDQVIANSIVAAPPASATALKVTHVWSEGGKERSFTRTAPPAAEGFAYDFTAGASPVNREVRIEGVAR